MTEDPSRQWALRLFERSPLKRRKFAKIRGVLGNVDSAGRYLDIGSDNGVISLLLRAMGGEWSSADLTVETVDSIRSLVGERVYRIENGRLPFPDGHFDAVVVVDLLEHLDDDAAMARELARVLRPGGTLVANVPNPHRGLIRRFRYLLGQTDAAHGHVRPGYSKEELQVLLGTEFVIEQAHPYARAFSEIFDTVITFALDKLKGARGKKGTVVTGTDVGKLRKSFRLYSFIAPAASLFVKLDELAPFLPTNMLIVRARRPSRNAS